MRRGNIVRYGHLKWEVQREIYSEHFKSWVMLPIVIFKSKEDADKLLQEWLTV